MIEPSTEDLLTDDEIVHLGRIRIGLDRIKEATARLNALAVESGFALRLLDPIPVALMGNDISILITAHERAENAIRDAAFTAAGLASSDMTRRAA